MLVFPEKILVGDPKHAVIAKFMIQLLLNFWSKLFTAIGIRPFPVSLLSFAPGITINVSDKPKF